VGIFGIVMEFFPSTGSRSMRCRDHSAIGKGNGTVFCGVLKGTTLFPEQELSTTEKGRKQRKKKQLLKILEKEAPAKEGGREKFAEKERKEWLTQRKRRMLF